MSTCPVLLFMGWEKNSPPHLRKKKKTLPNSSLPVSSRCQTPGAMRWRRRRRRPRAARRGHPPPPLPLHLPPPLPVLLLYRSSCAPVLQETLGASARGPQLRALFLCAGSSAPQLDVAVAGPSTQGSAAAAATPSHPLLASLSVRTGSATRYGWIWALLLPYLCLIFSV